MGNTTPHEHNSSDPLAAHRAWSRTAEILSHFAELAKASSASARS